MALNSTDLDRIAQLARLDLPSDERGRTLEQINGLFDLVERLRAVPVEGVSPLAHPLDVIAPVALRLADDLATEPDQREANQRSAPAVEQGLFLVPKVIE